MTVARRVGDLSLSLCLLVVVCSKLVFSQTLPGDGSPALEEYSCDRIDKVPAAQRCSFIREQCESDSRVPYAEWFYCHVAPHGVFAKFFYTLLLAALLPLLFTLLGDTAELYFSPIMTHVSQAIPKMRPRFAGVTFVAIGNGAPDLSSNISAIRNGDVLLSAGALTGAAMFVQCVVASEVMRASRGPVKCRGATLRDVAIYSAMILMVLAAFARGRISYWFIAVAVLLYLTYAVWVFVGDEWHEAGRPRPRTVWQAARAALAGGPSREEADGLPWAAVDEGPAAATAGGTGAASDSLSTPLVPRGPSASRPSHLSARAYQDLVWADLVPEDASGLARGTGAERATHGSPRRGPGRQHSQRSRRRGGAGGEAWAGGGGVELGSAPSGGAGTGYVSPQPDRAASGGSQLITLSYGNGAALAAPTLLEAAPPQGPPTAGMAGSSLSAAAPAPGPGGGKARRLSGAAMGPDGAGPWAGAGEGDPWVGGNGNGPYAEGGYPEGSGSGSEEGEGEDEDEERALLAGRRGGSGGDEAASVASSRRDAGREPRTLWRTVQHELTIGASAEWEELPPGSLRARWRAATFPTLLPLYAALRATIPFVDPASYSRPWLLVTCACAPSLAAAYLAPSGTLPYALLIALLIGGGLAGAVSYFTAGEDTLPDWDFGTSFAFGPAAFAIFGFFMGVIWIDTFASEAVGIISLLAALMRVPSSVMGLTLLAWGNSLGDYFGNPAMARRGAPSMALTACFAGPLFNMLASLSLGFASYFARRHVAHADVVLRPEVALGCVFLVLYNAAVAVTGLLNRGSLPPRFYLFARAWYGIYFAAACVLGLWAGQ